MQRKRTNTLESRAAAYFGFNGESFFAAVLLPLGLAYLFFARFTSLDGHGGLAPRSVRREQKVKDQAKEIERLEHELGIRS